MLHLCLLCKKNRSKAQASFGNKNAQFLVQSLREVVLHSNVGETLSLFSCSPSFARTF